MFFRRQRLRATTAVFSAVLVLLAGGCGILNPNLFSSFGGDSVRGLTRPNGAIVILVMNQTSSSAAVLIRVTKMNGGAVELSVPLDPFGPETELDHAQLVQECYVESIEFVSGSIQSDTGGDPIDIPAELPPVVYGLNLFCGSVVVITIVGIGLPPVISVY
jgi:hypothetical protein